MYMYIYIYDISSLRVKNVKFVVVQGYTVVRWSENDYSAHAPSVQWHKWCRVSASVLRVTWSSFFLSFQDIEDEVSAMW